MDFYSARVLGRDTQREFYYRYIRHGKCARLLTNRRRVRVVDTSRDVVLLLCVRPDRRPTGAKSTT